LDHLPNGRQTERGFHREPLSLGIGEAELKLFELLPRPGAALTAGSRVPLVGSASQPGPIDHIRRRIGYSDLTTTARTELPGVLEKIVRSDEPRFLRFFNESPSVSRRFHLLELLPGIGKKTMQSIVDERRSRPFSSFQDLEVRLHLKNPERLIVGRIEQELSGVEVARLRSLGVTPSKARGQSFLTDPFVADAEAALTEAEPGQPVVEIGGGLGILTEALLRRGVGPLTIIEKEPRFAAHLSHIFGSRVKVVTGDALDVDLPPARVVVGNLPFSVGTPILLRLFGGSVPRIVALVQREVADRLAAGPGSKVYGRLSIIAALYGRVELQQVVPAASFTPTPVVDGRIVTFERRTDPLPVPSVAHFERVVAALFAARRKQLGNLLPRVTPSGTDGETVAQEARWPVGWQRMRPEELPPDSFFRLARALHRPVTKI
jgi:putative nucleotide binding protein